MARKPIQIDRDKLRAAVRKLGNDYVFYMLDDAIELLPPGKLNELARKYLDLNRLRPDPEQAATRSLLEVVKRFAKASLAGEFYESFNVNSKNYTEKSAGTRVWIAEYQRLLAGRSRLGQGVAGLVYGSLVQGGARGVRQPHQGHTVSPLFLRP